MRKLRRWLYWQRPHKCRYRDWMGMNECRFDSPGSRCNPVTVDGDVPMCTRHYADWLLLGLRKYAQHIPPCDGSATEDVHGNCACGLGRFDDTLITFLPYEPLENYTECPTCNGSGVLEGESHE